MRKRQLLDSEGASTGCSWTSADAEDDEGFRQLLQSEEGCPECGYDGPLRSTRKGYKCPDCRTIVIPSE